MFNISDEVKTKVIAEAKAFGKEAIEQSTGVKLKREWKPTPAKDILAKAGIKVGNIKDLTRKWSEMELPETLTMVGSRMERVFAISGTNKRLIVRYGGRIECITWEVI